MQRLEFCCAVRQLKWSLGVKGLIVELRHPHMQSPQTCDYSYRPGSPSGWTQGHTVEGPYILRKAANLEVVLTALND